MGLGEVVTRLRKRVFARPLVGVVIDGRHGGDLIAAAQSVLAQDQDDMEILLLPPAPASSREGQTPAELKTIARNLATPSVRVSVLDTADLVRAIDFLRAQFFMLLDAHERLLPGALSACLRAVEATGAQVVCASSRSSADPPAAPNPAIAVITSIDQAADCILTLSGGTVLARRSLVRGVADGEGTFRGAPPTSDRVDLVSLSCLLAGLASGEAARLSAPTCMRVGPEEASWSERCDRALDFCAEFDDLLPLLSGAGEDLLIGGWIRRDLVPLTLEWEKAPASSLEQIRTHLPGSLEAAWTHLPLLDRLVVWVVTHGSDAEREMICREYHLTGAVSALHREGQWLGATLPVVSRLSSPVPTSLTRATRADLRAVAGATWVRCPQATHTTGGAGLACLLAWAVVPGVDSGDLDAVNFEILDQQGSVVDIPTAQPQSTTLADLAAGDPWREHAHSAVHLHRPRCPEDGGWLRASVRIGSDTLSAQTWLPPWPGEDDVVIDSMEIEVGPEAGADSARISDDARGRAGDRVVFAGTWPVPRGARTSMLPPKSDSTSPHIPLDHAMPGPLEALSSVESPSAFVLTCADTVIEQEVSILEVGQWRAALVPDKLHEGQWNAHLRMPSGTLLPCGLEATPAAEGLAVGDFSFRLRASDHGHAQVVVAAPCEITGLSAKWRARELRGLGPALAPAVFIVSSSDNERGRGLAHLATYLADQGLAVPVLHSGVAAEGPAAWSNPDTELSALDIESPGDTRNLDGSGGAGGTGASSAEVIHLAAGSPQWVQMLLTATHVITDRPLPAWAPRHLSHYVLYLADRADGAADDVLWGEAVRSGQDLVIVATRDSAEAFARATGFEGPIVIGEISASALRASIGQWVASSLKGMPWEVPDYLQVYDARGGGEEEAPPS
ncbi:MAG: hypothetical protein Q4C87_00515 [Actinomycetaceae bacterium]|nr:hypothetical protein [Actinomycetaceae bacterium]